ncbi:hypothetical protein K3727_08475 [Rhodobacteraceae bacterium M382]|nr:hypothetical protein K3727_08475 [Rhodobacteraceae bacterium M382]
MIWNRGLVKRSHAFVPISCFQGHFHGISDFSATAGFGQMAYGQATGFTSKTDRFGSLACSPVGGADSSVGGAEF